MVPAVANGNGPECEEDDSVVVPKTAEIGGETVLAAKGIAILASLLAMHLQAYTLHNMKRWSEKVRCERQ